MSESTAERYEFQTEARQLLDLMIHSVYSNKDIFLRELISNASDALDKRRFEAIKHPHILPEGVELHIKIVPDANGRTLSIVDNGIGMTREEVIELIGTIAKSGTRQFIEELKKSRDAAASAELIGQFGVGFYSTFMVADRVSLITRKAGETEALRWESTGDGTYTIEPAEREEAGTTVTLHLKPVDSEDGLHDYTQEWTIRQIVKQYSDFVAYPIRMDVERTESDRDEEGKVIEGTERKEVQEETLNSMKAIWLRDQREVTEEEYNEFYKHISHDWNEPLLRIQAKIEGTLEYRLLLYVPRHAPMDLFYREGLKHGVHLYVKRVFIMDNCEALLPNYLRFIRGVVDSEDLSLNISREILQQDRQIQRMRKGVIGKVLSSLKDLREKNLDEYKVFWKELGGAFKEGIFEDNDNRDAILDLCRFHSTFDKETQTTLRDYVQRMKDGQDAIYFLTGDDLKRLEGSPHLEAFKDKGYEVLLLTDRVDEVWTQHFGLSFEGKPFKSIGRGEVELGNEEERKQAEEERKEQEKDFRGLFDTIKGHLDAHVKEVRLSNRLKSSPAVLVTDTYDYTPQMEQMLRAMGQELPAVKRILELNAKHPLVQKLQDRYTADVADPLVADASEVLYGLAVLAEGAEVPDPARLSKALGDVLERAL